jgi:hypothetical protein
MNNMSFKMANVLALVCTLHAWLGLASQRACLTVTAIHVLERIELCSAQLVLGLMLMPHYCLLRYCCTRTNLSNMNYTIAV